VLFVVGNAEVISLTSSVALSDFPEDMVILTPKFFFILILDIVPAAALTGEKEPLQEVGLGHRIRLSLIVVLGFRSRNYQTFRHQYSSNYRRSILQSGTDNLSRIYHA